MEVQADAVAPEETSLETEPVALSSGALSDSSDLALDALLTEGGDEELMRMLDNVS
jgi:hypothetical protein